MSYDTGPKTEHLFRQQSSRIVSRLASLMGPAHFELAEDATQHALLRAMQVWPFKGQPVNPEAWLFRTAHHFAIDELRRRQLLCRVAPAAIEEIERVSSSQLLDYDGSEFRDDELRMIFACCHPEIPESAQVALSLKTIGGLSVAQIARAFFEDEATIAQRIVRAKQRIRSMGATLEFPDSTELADRLNSVLTAIYLIFNAGYTAQSGNDWVQEDLCGEALRMGRLVADSSIALPKAHALVALMAFQAMRFPTRVNENGELVLLEDQDPSLWDRNLAALGFSEFCRSMEGDELSGYHVQAAIASQYAARINGDEINWAAIMALYNQYLEIEDSPVTRLNRAVAVSKVNGCEAALRELEAVEATELLHDFYLLHAVRGLFLFDMGELAKAAESFTKALECECSEPERRFLASKLRASAAS